MNMNLGILIPILGLLIPILAIVMTNWRKVKEREMDLAEKGGVVLNSEARARMARLEERVQVLERIITDKRQTLADEIEDLRK
jgi:hypothetical protein